MSISRRILALSLVAATSTTLVACGNGEDNHGDTQQPSTAVGAPGSASTESRTIEHDLGTTDITGEVKNPVALEFSFVDTLTLLGTPPVGIADDDDADRITQLNGGDTLDYTSVGTRSEPNLELIASLKPDLIIADTDRHAKVLDQLQQIAPTVVLNSREGSYEDMKKNTVTIAKALGDEERGRAAVAEHEKRMEKIKAGLKNPGAEVQLATARDELLRLHTSSSFVGSVLESVGLKVPVDSDQPLEDASLERIAEVNPDILLVASDVDTPITDKWAGNPAWEGIDAVRDGRVYQADRNLFTRFRGLQSAEEIAKQAVSWVDEK